MSKILAYRALMPAHFTPRRTTKGAPETDQDGSRKWVATRLPAIRVYGPFWSFGFQVHESPKATVWPDKVPALRGLRALAEVADGGKANPQLAKPHYPTLLSVHLKSFLQVSPEPKGDAGKFEFWESRMSLLAIRSIDPAGINESGQLIKFDPNDFPVVNGTVVEGPATLLVAPFGDPQPRPEKTFKEDNSGKTKEVDAVTDQHLPAMQLIHGQVRFKPGSAYLEKSRKALGLSAPSGEIAPGDTIVLLPDGFAVAGAIDVPWMGADSISGWFKVTFRWLDPEKDRAIVDGKAVDIAPAPVLRPWFDAEDDNASGRRAWSDVIARLELLMRSAGQHDAAPRWLDIRPNARLSAEDFFWPLEYDGKKEEPSILLHRPKRDVVIIDGAGLLVRLADRPLADAPLSTLTIEPEAFVVTKGAGGKSFTIETERKLPAGKSVLVASYTYAEPVGDRPQTETISVDTLDDMGKLLGRVDLSVPMIETADGLRQAMGLPRPIQTTGKAAALPMLWAFTPLDEGWLHWPLPNATPGILSRLIGDNVSSVEPLPPANEAGDGISGAIMFGNRPGDPGYSPKQRNWSFAMGEPRQGSLSATLQLLAENGASFTAAKIDLRDFAVSFDGVVPLTPFRQTPERLLPDHAERALVTGGLRAVSPYSLSKLERDLLATKGAPRFSVVLAKLQLENSIMGAGNQGARRTRVDADLSWSLFMPASTELDAPWIWVRHASMPTVQTMPLAAAGKARNRPAETPSLAPFVYARKGTTLTYACRAGGLDMARPTIALDPTMKDSVGAGEFRRPPGDRAAGGWPMAEWRWREEIGMAVTTLPSLTLFPGQKGTPGLAAGQWSTYPVAGAVTAVARHDIALRDQFHALSVAPTKPEPGKEAAPPLALFTPRTDNAPYGDRVTNGYDLVWTELSRKAGLAALDRRDMLAINAGKPSLAGVFGETTYTIADVQFDFSVDVVREEGGQANAVTQIGRWSLEGVTGVEPSSMMFAGLPQDGDLVGISGTFLRGADKVQVRHGTAALRSQGRAFADQHGIEAVRTDRPAANGPIIRRVTNRALKKAHDLLTLVQPMKVLGTGLSFWCADVPVGAGSTSFLATYADDHATRLNGGSLDNDAFAGFRWTLANPDAPAETVVIDGMVFQPLVLTGLTVDPITVTIRGRLLLPVGAPPVLPCAGGTATLTLTADSAGNLMPQLRGADIVWPLVEPQTASGFVPTLTIKVLPEKGKDIAAQFSFGFAGAVFSVPLTLKWSSVEGRLLEATLTGAKAGDTPFGAIDTDRFDLAIGRAEAGQDGQPAHSAKLRFKSRVGQPDAQLLATLTHDLLAPEAPNAPADTQLAGPTGIKFDIESDIADADSDVSDADKMRAVVAFDADHFAFRWRLKHPTNEELRPLLLDGFAVAEATGAFFATLRVDTKTAALKKLPSIQLVGLEEQSRFELSTWSSNVEQLASLQLVRQRRSGETTPKYRLFGSFAVANAFSWPQLSVIASGDFEQATLRPDAAGRISHKAVITFRGDPLLADERGGFMVTAAVAHSFETVGETWTWQAHQVVRLLPQAAFSDRLATLATPGSKKPADIQKLDTGFSPLVGQAGSPLTDYAAVPHFLHVAASGPGGIAGPLADRLLAAIKAKPARFMAVDLSAHLLLGFGSTDARPLAGPLILASVPAIGFCLEKEGGLPWSKTPEVVAMLATQVAADTKILQSATDGIEARGLPQLEHVLAGRLVTRLGDASGRAEHSAAASLLARDGDKDSHRPVFQAVVLRQEHAVWQPAWDLPGAATAMHLSALLDASARSTEPAVVGFRPFGGISGDDLFPPQLDPAKHPLTDITRVDVDLYTLAMRRFRKRLIRDLVAGPGVAPSAAVAPRPAAVLLRLVARSRDGDNQSVVVEERESASSKQLETIRAHAADWGRMSLERLAPWAATGLVAIFIDERGVQSDEARIVRSGRPATRRTISPQPIAGTDMPVQQQREKIARAAGDPRTIAGYSPLVAEPRLFTSEPAWTYGEDEADFGLTATGVAMAWSLLGGNGATLGDAPGSNRASAYWITDRYRPAFRPFSVAGPEITFALPEQYGAQLPGSLVPAHHADAMPAASRGPDQGSGTSQSFAPAIVTTSRISSRPGALASTRTGLITVVEGRDDRQWLLDAAQTPLSMRQPRPPVLARNDRARASSQETGPFHLSRNPTVIVHGPRAAPFGASAFPVGLDRRPRSKFAMRLVLDSPKAGVATPEWDGEVKVVVDDVFGAEDNVTWTVKSAAIIVGADRYAWKHAEKSLSGESRTISLVDFRGSAGGTGLEQSARDALRAVAPATPAVLEITLAYARPNNEGSLLRQIRFELLSAGVGMAVPGVEAPLFFRFDDPEYNDQLQGLAKLAREGSPAVPGEDFVFAADLADVRPDQRLELALALRPATVGAEVTKKFEADNGRLTYDGELVVMTVERHRAGQIAGTPLGSKEVAIDNAVAAGKWGRFYLTGAGPTAFHAMKVDCALLKESLESVGPALAPDDQLQLVLSTEGPKKHALVTLRFDVVVSPNMPANQSSFGILVLKPDGKSVPVHLFAAGPEAAVIELVDPLELIEGVVRRRAIFQWRSFHHAQELDEVPPAVNPARFALQKISGTGGTWLPGEVQGGWLAAPC
ncbi:hypothetical protein NKI50_27160 [Mesorhizobium sp. M0563]|uniref:hypothetical protein n=1 Tax=Mesorhizobium sp. M0563 TaxID=2956959 RepID=UPI003337E78B